MFMLIRNCFCVRLTVVLSLVFSFLRTDALAKETIETTVLEQSQNVAKQTVLLVSPPVFDSALQPWIEYRQSQGYDVLVLPIVSVLPDGSYDLGIQTRPVATPEEIRAKIVKVAKERDIAAIVLVGDGAPTIEAKYGWRDITPAARVQASVVQVFGSEDVLATDSFYADLDGDELPDVPIGRLSVSTPDELRAVVSKIIRYETSSPVGNWMRKINIITGPNGLDLSVIGSKPGENLGGGSATIGGLSSLVDSVVTNMARKLFSEFLPQEFAVSLTQCSLQSVFCPYPADFNKVFIDRINEGSLFFVYMGHGQPWGLDRLDIGVKEYAIFEKDDCSSLNSPNTSPIVFFFACYTGAYDANEQALAEKIANSPNGPIAVYAASRLTAPYGMSVLGAALLDSAFNDSLSGPKTLGQIILNAQKKALEIPPQTSSRDESTLFEEHLFEDKDESAQDELVIELNDENDSSKSKETNSDYPGAQLEKINRRLARNLQTAEIIKEKNSSFRLNIDRVAAIFDPTATKLDEQIRDHILEFNLFGDPLLRLALPERVEVDAPEIAYSTKDIVVSGIIPELEGREAVVQIELLPADFRSPVKKGARARTFIESDEARKEFQNTYRSANVFVVDAIRTTTKKGFFEAKILAPENYSGESVVRIAAYDGDKYYIGSSHVLVRPFSKSQD